MTDYTDMHYRTGGGCDNPEYMSVNPSLRYVHTDGGTTEPVYCARLRPDGKYCMETLIAWRGKQYCRECDAIDLLEMGRAELGL